jgi:hypothetical protein
MQIDKQQIIDFLRQQGDEGKADQADRDLPQQVDTDNQEDQNLLERLGVNVRDMLSRFTSGGGLGL